MGTILKGGDLVKLQGLHKKIRKIKGKTMKIQENKGKPRRGGVCNFNKKLPPAPGLEPLRDSPSPIKALKAYQGPYAGEPWHLLREDLPSWHLLLCGDLPKPLKKHYKALKRLIRSLREL